MSNLTRLCLSYWEILSRSEYTQVVTVQDMAVAREDGVHWKNGRNAELSHLHLIEVGYLLKKESC